MATRFAAGSATALPALLSTIPSLPRPVLARLVESIIAHLDEVDGDDDLEDGDVDYCTASEDRGSYGRNARFPEHDARMEGDADEDCERWHQPVSLN